MRMLKNYGVVNWHDLTEESLTEAINIVLVNPELKKTVSDLSDIIMDQPQHPLDQATIPTTLA